MVSTTTGTGGGKGAEEQYFPGFTGLGGGRAPQRACVSAFGYGFDRVSRGSTQHTHPVSPTHPYDRRETEATQRNNQAEKGSWLKQVGKVTRVEK